MTILDELIALREHIQQKGEVFCLCWTAGIIMEGADPNKDLIYHKMVAKEKGLHIFEYIENNRPEPNSSLATDYTDCESSYYWKPNDKAPRLAWLDYHIEKLQKEEKK